LDDPIGPLAGFGVAPKRGRAAPLMFAKPAAARDGIRRSGEVDTRPLISVSRGSLQIRFGLQHEASAGRSRPMARFEPSEEEAYVQSPHTFSIICMTRGVTISSASWPYNRSR
jgi:hypothetical protein